MIPYWLILMLVLVGIVPVRSEWPQWGGPDRNFIVQSPPLASVWPESGPPKIWEREDGLGYSAIIIAGGALFTAYHEGEEDVIISLSLADGRKRWTFRYDEPFKGEGYGPGPNTTPIVAGQRLFMVSGAGKIHALDPASGELLWSRDLVAEFQAFIPWHGYAACPLAFEELLILPAGGRDGYGAIALSQADGRVVWYGHDMLVGYASPLLIEPAGIPQAVFFTKNRIAGLDPHNGRMIWEIANRKQPIHNVALTPLWGPDLLLWTSIRGMRDGDGARTFRLKAGQNGAQIEELWWEPRMRVEPHANAVRVGDIVYATLESGRRGRLAAIDVSSGEILWEEGSVDGANLVYAGGKLIILDEKGQLALAQPDRNAANITARTRIQTTRSWTPPTLSGSRLYYRDSRQIIVFELGHTQESPNENETN